ncbi:hypothetical protein AG4045_012366 [Apium graveolens]|uniref:Uncharacterized protein n=1 Tax=Apium graveolens TaxID=4045 RepID=A0A6L5B8W8_APIGR|nr:hypothetical protein AG4045_012366 [Apium graveolens]
MRTSFSISISNSVVTWQKFRGIAYGSLENPKATFSGNVKLKAGINKISLLSAAVGLPNVGVHYERKETGILGPVTLKGLMMRNTRFSKADMVL